MSKKSGKKNARKCGKCGRTGHYAKTCKYKTRAPKPPKAKPVTATEVDEMIGLAMKELKGIMKMETGLLGSLIIAELKRPRNPYQQPKLVTCPRCKGKGKIQEGHKFHPQQGSPFSKKRDD